MQVTNSSWCISSFKSALCYSSLWSCRHTCRSRQYQAFYTAIHITTGYCIVHFFMMRGDPADPLTAARSLRDYVCCIIMLHKHNDYRRLYGTTAGHNDRSPIVIYNSLLYHCANCLVIACGADVSTGVGWRWNLLLCSGVKLSSCGTCCWHTHFWPAAQALWGDLCHLKAFSPCSRIISTHLVGFLSVSTLHFVVNVPQMVNFQLDTNCSSLPIPQITNVNSYFYQLYLALKSLSVMCSTVG